MGRGRPDRVLHLIGRRPRSAAGAGDGNRTRVASLEEWVSADHIYGPVKIGFYPLSAASSKWKEIAGRRSALKPESCTGVATR